MSPSHGVIDHARCPYTLYIGVQGRGYCDIYRVNRESFIKPLHIMAPVLLLFGLLIPSLVMTGMCTCLFVFDSIYFLWYGYFKFHSSCKLGSTACYALLSLGRPIKGYNITIDCLIIHLIYVIQTNHTHRRPILPSLRPSSWGKADEFSSWATYHAGYWTLDKFFCVFSIGLS